MTAHPVFVLPAPSEGLRPSRFFGALLLWGAAVAVFSASGLTRAVPPRLIPVPIAGGMLALLVAYGCSPRVHALLRHTDIRHLTYFNGWRIVAALAFFAAGARGLLPAVFVQRAAWGDLVAGVLGLLVPIVLPPAARFRRPGFLAFHLLSFADFVSAVGTGIALNLQREPLMANIRDFPIALIPMWGVPITGALSVIALWRCFTEQRLDGR